MKKIILILLIISISCKKQNNELVKNKNFSKELKEKEHSKILRKAYQTDTIKNDKLLQQIRTVFKVVSQNLKKYKTIETPLNESVEGGVLIAYTENGKLKKIEEKHFGEMGKLFIDYYFSKEKVIFVFSQNFDYNKPMYLEGSKISKIKENRYYFDNNKLFKWLDPNKKEVSNVVFDEKQQKMLKRVFELKKKIEKAKTNKN